MLCYLALLIQLSNIILAGVAAASSPGGGGPDPAAALQLHGGGDQVPQVQAERGPAQGTVPLRQAPHQP